jgi:DNA-binding Lrp family transcriptional regulator
MKIDHTDIKILNELKKNSRIAIRDLAKKTNTIPSTAHLRMQKLVKEKVIERFTVKLDNKAVGEDFIVFMQISASQQLPDEFFDDSCIKESFMTTGEYDLLLKLKFRDISEFNKFLSSLRKNKMIAKITTTVATQNIKEELN